MRILNLFCTITFIYSNLTASLACGIIGWDPVGYCKGKDGPLARLPSKRLKEAVNYVGAYFDYDESNSENLQTAFSDITIVLMELKDHDKDEFQF